MWSNFVRKDNIFHSEMSHFKRIQDEQLLTSLIKKNVPNIRIVGILQQHIIYHKHNMQGA